MKKIIALFSVIAVAILSFSCAKNTVEEVSNVQGGFITVKCTLSNETPDSKVSLNATSGKTEWVDGDNVLFHGQKMGTVDENVYSYVASAHDVSADGKTASFTIPDLASKYASDSYLSSIFAIYPASAAYSFSDGANWYYASSFKETNQLLVAGYNLDKDADPYTFYFINLTGALSFKVSGDFDAYLVTGNNNETVGWDRYTITAAQCSSWKEHRTCYRGSTGPGATSGPHTSVYVEPTGSEWHDGTTVNTVYFPGTGDGTDLDGDGIKWNEAANFTKGFTIKFYKDGAEVKRVSTSTAKNIHIGELLDLGDVTSHLKTPPAHVPASWTSGAEDLVVSNPANSYIVYHEDVSGYSANAGKAFRIPAVKGKSSTSVGTVASVSILWETYNGTSDTVTPNTVIEAVDYDASYIYFKMPAHSVMHAGNALIAAKNAMGTTLWSWHIWVPSSVVSPITNTKFSPTAVMDRNLGAIQPAVASESTVPVEAYGLYYQWGRKDPFFTNDWKRNASTDITFVNPGTVSTEESVQNPTVWYYNSSENWNSSDVTTLWDDSGKTIYDPCPEGYRTSPRNTSYAMWNYSSSSGSPGWTSSSYGWYKFGDGDPDGYGNVIVFPYAGYASSKSLSYGGARNVVWGATRYNSERGYGLYIRHDKVSEPSGIYNYNSYYKCYMGSVRCVAE